MEISSAMQLNFTVHCWIRRTLKQGHRNNFYFIVYNGLSGGVHKLKANKMIQLGTNFINNLNGKVLCNLRLYLKHLVVLVFNIKKVFGNIEQL